MKMLGKLTMRLTDFDCTFIGKRNFKHAVATRRLTFAYSCAYHNRRNSQQIYSFFGKNNFGLWVGFKTCTCWKYRHGKKHVPVQLLWNWCWWRYQLRYIGSTDHDKMARYDILCATRWLPV